MRVPTRTTLQHYTREQRACTRPLLPHHTCDVYTVDFRVSTTRNGELLRARSPLHISPVCRAFAPLWAR